MLLPNRYFFEQVEAMLAAGRQVELRMRGNSMRPLLRDGRDVAVLRPIARYAAPQEGRGRRAHGVEALRTGDIVLFRNNGRHVLHRIIRIEPDARNDTPPGQAVTSVSGTGGSASSLRFSLAGDGNCRTTEQCTADDILAVLHGVVRPDGRFVSCRSQRWRLASRCWLALPQAVRQQLLRAMGVIFHS